MTYPSTTADERDALEQFLDFHRDRVLKALDEVSDTEAATRVLGATDMTVGGIVKHLAAVEDLWFHRKLLDVPSSEPWRSAPFDQDPDWEWHSAAEQTVVELRKLYVDACATSRAVAGRISSLDEQAKRASFGEQFVNLRWVYLHMIEETAQHRGHLDLLLDAIRQARPSR
ncbi:DinB family protein [Kribbella sp. NPDC056951]|uniref:DinB family protein n=1 Tax=Kribbella sp. NPDC056951 TaxID=3345978 RepID=UPI003645EA3C